MDPLYVRYPFFEGARAAVRELGVELETLVERDAPAVTRGRERVERALTEGNTAPPDPMTWKSRAELLSYPIARVLISLLDERAAVEKYATAEAKTAYERFVEDIERDRETRDAVTLDRLLAEFDLVEAVRPETSTGRGPRQLPVWFQIDVGPYLTYMDPDWGSSWRLVNRELVDGAVRIRRVGRGNQAPDELYRLLRAATRDRVADGLPFDGVDDALATALEPQIADLRALLADRSVDPDIDEEIHPDLFPPCLQGLLQQVREGRDPDPPARFALLSFLAALNATVDEAVALCEGGYDSEMISTTFAYLRDKSGSQYPPPSCETLAAYGLCENAENHRDIASHPLTYYVRQLERSEEIRPD